MSLMGIVYAIIALSVLIIVHEFGHFLFARLVGVKVLAFSLGFGKKLLSFRRGETEYALSAMPLGGYVKLLGESPDEEIPEEDKARSFSNKTPFQRFLIVFAGPAFNILFAIVAIYFTLVINGYGILPAQVKDVQPGFPAYEAGLRQGDKIVDINGVKISGWEDLTREIAFSDDAPLKVIFERDGKTIEAVMTPKVIEERSELGNMVKRKKLGIIVAQDVVWKRENPITAIPHAINVTYSMTKTMVRGIYHMIAGDISTKELGGPIAILQLTGKHAKNGLWSLVTFVAFISINLGILNLLPVPVLDGGHVLFTFVEVIIRRKIPDKVVDIAQKIGLTLLIMLMVFAFYNDILRIVQTKGFADKLGGLFRFFSGKHAP